METIVCADCGLEVGERRDGIWLHIEEPKAKGWQPHDVSRTMTRTEYLSGVEVEQESAPRPPAYRQADALERIATALEWLVERERRKEAAGL